MASTRVRIMPESSRILRCGIYTRKSTTEGLEQEFNSLEAQRESAEAYIASQRQAGWTALAERYDDGGVSGASLERPALCRLLSDVESGRVDCVVVYKVDRLSRSLLDFARLMSLFERRGISFVSVTQEFNTTTSMGRLTLNILLSFAQFEREIIGERTRDKLGAARRKGKWIGGIPVLGYDVDPRGGRLLVNAAEAERVREIFAVAASTTTLTAVLREIDERGYTTKDWTSQGGRQHPGRPFSKNALAALLNNVLYIGSVSHKGVVYPGEQEAIVDRDLWERVTGQLSVRSCHQRGRPHHKQDSLLAGLVSCAKCGRPMTMTHTRVQERRYTYYVCKRDPRQPRCKQRPLAAADFERALAAQLRPVLGYEPGRLNIEQAIERVSWDGELREVSVGLRDNTRFAFQLPEANRPGQQRHRQERERVGRIPRISRLMALAIRIHRLVSEGKFRDYAELARLGQVSRPRVSQILNLLNLRPSIQEAVLFLPGIVAGPDPVTEKRLRRIAQVIDWESQQALFQALIGNGNLG